MNFISLLLFILIGIGITNIVVNATILEKVRGIISEKSEFFSKLLECMLCSGFWIGAFLSIFYPDIGFVAGGAIVSLLSYTYGSLMDFLHASTEVKEAQVEYIDVKE